MGMNIFPPFWWLSFNISYKIQVYYHFFSSYFKRKACYKGYIAKCTLARPMGSSTSHTRNPSNSTTSTPWFSRCLMSSMFAHSIGLALVLWHLWVHKMNNILSDRGKENFRHSDISCHFPFTIKDWNQWASCSCL